MIHSPLPRRPRLADRTPIVNPQHARHALATFSSSSCVEIMMSAADFLAKPAIFLGSIVHAK
jgi:hypothetical protein